MSSTNNDCMSGRGSRRNIAPNPSTVPMRVSAEIVGSGAPWRMRYLDCSMFGKFSGHVSSGMANGSIPDCSSRRSSQATIAGARNRVRGETYVPSSSKPPWQWTPFATRGSTKS